MYPYIREARRIRAEFTMLEQHISAETRHRRSRAIRRRGRHRLLLPRHAPANGVCAVRFLTQVWPYQIPLGSLIPAAHPQPDSGVQEPRRHTRRQLRNPPASGRVGDRRGRRNSRCVLRSRARSEPSAVRATERRLRELQSRADRPGRRARLAASHARFGTGTSTLHTPSTRKESDFDDTTRCAWASSASARSLSAESCRT